MGSFENNRTMLRCSGRVSDSVRHKKVAFEKK